MNDDIRQAMKPKRPWNPWRLLGNLATVAATLFVVWMLNSIAVAWFSSWILKGG